METSQGGFTLIELMVVLAVISFLVTIAIPAYQDYVVRTKVAEITVFADSAKSNLSDYYLSAGHMPNSASEANIVTASDQSQYVSSVAFSTTANSATITYTVKNMGISGDIAWVGSAYTHGIKWACNTSATTIAGRYLPKNCR